MPAVSRLLSVRAIFAAATANWLNRAADFAMRAGIQSRGLKSRTSPTMRHSSASFDPSNSVGAPMPDRPASAEAQNLSTPTPMGETMPSPVMTGCRFIGWSSPEGRWPAFLPTKPVLTLPGPRPNDQVSQVGRLVEYVNCRDMSRKAPSRREFLTLPLALILAPLIGGRPAGAAPDAR